MEKKQPGAILMVVGGALMALGSFLTWLTASLDLSALAAAIKQQIGVDVSGVPGFANTQHSFSAAGTKGWEGKLALVVGIVALAVGLVVILASLSNSVASKVAFATGGIGILVAVEAMLTKSSGIESAKMGSAGQLSALGLTPSVFDNAFKVSVGIGLYMAIVGGIVAIVGGIMLLGKDAATATATTATSTEGAPAAGSGWEAPAAPPPMAPPSMPATPPTPEPPAPMGDAGGAPES
jgi:hypothetical protein